MFGKDQKKKKKKVFNSKCHKFPQIDQTRVSQNSAYRWFYDEDQKKRRFSLREDTKFRGLAESFFI